MVQVELRSGLSVQLAMRLNDTPVRLREEAFLRPTEEDFGSLRETYAEYLARLSVLASLFGPRDESALQRAA